MSGSASMSAGESSSDGGSSSTGDPPPPCELKNYQCHMKRIQVYSTSMSGVDFRTINPQPANAGEGVTFDCVDVDILFSESALNAAMLEQACLEACYLTDPGFAVSINFAMGADAYEPTNLDADQPNPVCVMDSVSTLPTYGASGSAHCAVEHTAATDIDDLGYATEDQCMVAIESCDGWDPPSIVTHTTDRTGLVHTTTIPQSTIDEFLYSDGWGYLYACDAARYQQIISGGAESWQIVEATSGEFIYAMGLRNGDKDFTIAKSPTSTQYALNSFAALAAAFDQMAGDSTLTLRFKRQNVAGAWVTHTMSLSFV